MKRQAQLLAAATLIVLVLVGVRPARAQGESSSHAVAESRIVNVTSDSAPGWLPSVEQARAASEAVIAYLAARDNNRAEKAYDMLEGGNRAVQPFTTFSRDLAGFNKQAGTVVERRIVNVTWTKDPAQAPQRGVYAAIDIVSRFTNIDRDCGYVAVHQAPAGGPFRVGREEANLMTNAGAATIERQQSKAAVEAAWSQLSMRCPNYPGESALLSAMPLPEQADSIGYPTVASALVDLRSRPSVAFKSEDGWTIAKDDASHTIWVFTSEGQPAYPAVIKRQFVAGGHGGSSLEMKVLCEASKAACDNLVRTFEALNARMIAAVHGGK